MLTGFSFVVVTLPTGNKSEPEAVSRSLGGLFGGYTFSTSHDLLSLVEHSCHFGVLMHSFASEMMH